MPAETKGLSRFLSVYREPLAEPKRVYLPDMRQEQEEISREYV